MTRSAYSLRHILAASTIAATGAAIAQATPANDTKPLDLELRPGSLIKTPAQHVAEAGAIPARIWADNSAPGTISCRPSSQIVTFGSYHKGDRGYEVPVRNEKYANTHPKNFSWDVMIEDENGEMPFNRGFKKYNETNIGLIQAFDCPDMPAGFKKPGLIFITANSFEQPSFMFAFENDLAQWRHARLSTLFGAAVTGYGSARAILAVAAEGKGNLCMNLGKSYALCPWAMVMPTGLVSGKNATDGIYVYGVRLSDQRNQTFDPHAAQVKKNKWWRLENLAAISP